MLAVTARLSGVDKRRVAFTIPVLAALAVYFGLMQGWRNNVFLISSWMGGIGVLPEEFLEIGHRLHEFAFALVVWPLVFGLLAQLRSPRKHVTGMLMAVVTILAVLLAMALTGFWDPVMILAFLGVPVLLAALLHPSGRALVTSVEAERVSRVMLALVVVAAVPMLAFAATQVGLQTGAIEPAGHDHGGAGHSEVHEQHVEFGHFAFTAAFTFAVLGTALLASLRQRGWWLGAWVAGLMMASYAVASLLAPEASSNPGALWSVAALVWSVGFVAAAELTQGTERPSLLGSRIGDSTAA